MPGKGLMVYTGQLSRKHRVAAASAAIAAVALIGLGLASGLDLTAVRTASEAITAIALPAPSPEKPPPPEAPQTDKAAGESAPPAEVARAAPVVASQPKVPQPKPPPVAAAPVPGQGSEASAGAAPLPGPGSGAGGQGSGTGSGGSGDGVGGGARPILLSGRIRDNDYPRAASRAKIGGEVEVRFTIETSGRVTRCRITRSSGDAALDATTCRLIEERFRFRPATNAAGAAVASQYGWRQSWWLERRR